MQSVDHIWSGWRSEYVSKAAEEARERLSGRDAPECVLCALADKGKDYYVIAKNEYCFAVMNLYPYTNGHMMVIPFEHMKDLQDFDTQTQHALIEMTSTATRVLTEVYNPDGINAGLNMGNAAGAGVPGHLHMHIVPRWFGDSGFITATANQRTLPEALESSYSKLHEAWPSEERI